jgi:hypothetical protein
MAYRVEINGKAKRIDERRVKVSGMRCNIIATCDWLPRACIVHALDHGRRYSKSRNKCIAKFARIGAEKGIFPNLEFSLFCRKIKPRPPQEPSADDENGKCVGGVEFYAWGHYPVSGRVVRRWRRLECSPMRG